MQQRANVLKESQPKSAHILVNGNTVVVALNGQEIKTDTANSVNSICFWVSFSFTDFIFLE